MLLSFLLSALFRKDAGVRTENVLLSSRISLMSGNGFGRVCCPLSVSLSLSVVDCLLAGFAGRRMWKVTGHWLASTNKSYFYHLAINTEFLVRHCQFMATIIYVPSPKQHKNDDYINKNKTSCKRQ